MIPRTKAIPAAICVTVIGLLVASSLGPPTIDLARTFLPPGADSALGTDELGRSVARRLLQTAPFSLGLALLSALGAVAVGAAMGTVAGWFGGWTDRLVTAAIDFFWSVPVAVFAVLILTIVPASFASLVLTIIAVNWVSSARIFRTAVQRLRSSTFLVAARARGITTVSLLISEVGPNLIPLALLLLGFSAAEALTLEGGLALLGLGMAPPAPSWGGMVASGLAFVAIAPWIALAPAAVMMVFIAFVRGLASRVDQMLYR